MSNGTRQPTLLRYGGKDLPVRFGPGDRTGSAYFPVRDGIAGQPSPLARARRARITVMSFADSALDVLTTPQAAALVGRHESSLKHALADGKLPGVRTFAGWQIRREDVIAWDHQARRYRRGRTATWNQAADLLATHGPATAAEVADLLDINVGNARKHLAILAKEGRAQRGPDGRWILTGPDEARQSVAC
jgi:hypothetical protein